MHFLTLVPVTVPEQEPDPIKDVLVQTTLMALREKTETNPEDFMAKIFASELTGKTTPFGRAVFDAVYEKLDPYAVETENPACREFTDCTDEITETAPSTASVWRTAPWWSVSIPVSAIALISGTDRSSRSTSARCITRSAARRPKR